MTAEVLPASYTVCLYLRLSKGDDDIYGSKTESDSITSQRRLLRDYIRQNPEFQKCRVIERCDDGMSGKYFETRPGFTDMIDLTKKGQINCIIVKDCSRFGRDYVELGDYLEQLFPFLGVRFISVNDHYDSAREEGGLDLAFRNLVYDVYARDISKKERAVRKSLAEQGKYCAVQALFGYKKSETDRHKLVIDPEAAAIVREIFDLRLTGTAVKDIAKSLNERGIPCATEYKLRKKEITTHPSAGKHPMWSSSTVCIVLSNENYTGTGVAHKSTSDTRTGKLVKRPEEEWIRVEGRHEAIVSREEFDAVQAMRKKPVRRSKPRKFIRYHCGICGRILAGNGRESLHCYTADFTENSVCSKVKINKKKTDAYVLAELKARLKQVLDQQELMLKKSKPELSPADEIRAVQVSLQAAEKSKRTLIEKLADRTIDRETFKKKKKEYDAEIDALTQRLEDMRAAAALAAGQGEEENEVKSFLDVTEMTEEIWKRFVKDVRVFPDKRIEIEWNFGEE